MQDCGNGPLVSRRHVGQQRRIMAKRSGKPENIPRGIGLRIAAAGCFSIMSALFKMAGEHGVAAPEMLLYRAIFGIPVILIWVWSGPGLGALSTRRPWAHVLRVSLGIASILCVFQGLILLPLADAATIGFTTPIFAIILSWALLKERIGPRRWLAVLCGFLGVVIVMRPGGSGVELPLAGVAFALVGALGAAGVTITLRQMGRTEHVAAITFWFFVGSAAVGVILWPFVGQIHDWRTTVLLALGGIAGGLAQLTMTASLQSAPVSVVAPFDYLQIIGAILLGWLLLATVPTINTLAGGAIIAGSGLYAAWRERLATERRKKG